jgi:hypothetical protein
VSDNDNLKDHLAKVEDARRRLSEIDRKIQTGTATTETYIEMADAYQAYVKVRTEDVKPTDSGLLGLLKKLGNSGGEKAFL